MFLVSLVEPFVSIPFLNVELLSKRFVDGMHSGHRCDVFQIRGLVRCTSCQDFFHYMPVHVGQAEVSAAVAVGQFFVVEAHQAQDGGV